MSKSSQVRGTSNAQETRLDMRSNEYIESWHGYHIYDMGYYYTFIPMTDNSIDSPMISKYINSWGGYTIKGFGLAFK
jgi:hypothetical protein